MVIHVCHTCKVAVLWFALHGLSVVDCEPAPECSSYSVLSEADRYVTASGVSKCDSSLVEQWYRFQGAAGVSLADSCPSKHVCGADATGWLNGAHPSVNEGQVSRTVCFHYSSSCCHWSNTITVLNCGDFYVYKLRPPPACSLRYCGIDADECALGTHNCSSQATCSNTPASFTCTCQSGYAGNGQTCVDSDECTTNTHDCNSDATCANNVGSFTCTCNQGYTGSGQSCTDNDECTTNTHDCHSDATCANNAGSFTCSCNNGYSGDGQSCTDDDECAVGSHSCSSHATCSNTPGSFTCACQSGYTGDGQTCEDSDECTANTHDCHSDATCANNAGSFTCTCNNGYSGDGQSCTDDDECAVGSHSCSAQATCSNTPGSFTCACQSGYTGDGQTCEDSDECTANTHDCHSDATCANNAGSFTCTCNNGYSGDGQSCTDDDECAVGSHSCSAQATCSNTPGSFTCACQSGYTGDGQTCEDSDECTANTHDCHSDATCANNAGSFTCTCNNGYSGDGQSCTDADECTSGQHGCSPHATCGNVPGSYTCSCLQGYAGSGRTCEDNDECTTNTHDCHSDATCTNNAGSFTCSCNNGYSGDGQSCTDVDECAVGNHNCSAHATCSNVLGSFTCGCSQGYTGNGQTCVDINECQEGTHDCDSNADCTSTVASFTCQCFQGYSGDGMSCTDIDECTTHGHDCSPQASCSNTDGSFTCTCLAGFSGDGTSCVDIEECATDVDNCDDHADCTNTIGSFNCTCTQGYSGNGTTCVDIDECETKTHNCHGVALCTNNPGSFSCACRESYTGDGITCEPDGDFSVTIRDISKDKYNATIVNRSIKTVLEAILYGLPEGANVTESTLGWRLVSEEELEASVSAEGTLVSQGTGEWTINRRSIAAGSYQVKFTASFTIGDSSSSNTLKGFNYGFIEVVAAPLVAIIDGGTSVRWGSDETISVNGSLSYDGDIGPGSLDGLNFTWSCRNLMENVSSNNDCFGSFVDQSHSSPVLTIDTRLLQVGQTYVLKMVVSKDKRSSFFEMQINIALGEVPRVTLRCFVDCGSIVAASNKLRMTTECLNSACDGAVYKWVLEKLSNDSDTWENVTYLANITSTAVNATNMIIKKNSLQSSSKYRLVVYVNSLMGTEGFAMLEFETAGKPYGGFCRPSVSEGTSLETEFYFECFDWQDKSGSLSYEFGSKDGPISYGISSMSVSSVLPPGLPEEDYQTQISVTIRNAVGVSVTSTMTVKVKPSSQLDPCLSSSEEMTENLKSLVLGKDSKLDGFLRKGEVSPAVQLGITVLKSTREKTECGQTLSVEIKTFIATAVVEKFATITPESLSMSRLILSVIREATADKDVICEICSVLAAEMTVKATKVLSSTLADVEEPMSAEAEETAGSVMGCLANVLQSGSGSTQSNATAGNQSVPKANADKAVGEMNRIGDAFSGRMVASESLVLKMPEMSMSLKKVTSDDLKGLSMEEGPTQFKMPESFNTSGGSNVNAKMMAFDFNPFSWDVSSKMVKSSVSSLDLKSEGDDGAMNVSNLENDIEMVIPINSDTSPSNDSEVPFLKPNQMAFRTYYAELANVPVSIKLAAEENNAFIEVVVKYGSRPSMEDFDLNFTVAFTSICDNKSEDFQSKSNCTGEATTLTVLPDEPGLLYVGLLFLGENNITEHTRKRRSCFGNGRERRSCVGFKDPPPKGINQIVKLEYDPSTDVNYTMAISQSACLYWSASKDKWTSEGCKVGEGTNGSYLKCLCNHLTSFGGSFIQAPNPIDFDKVFLEFSRLSETGNISVLVTIACAFVLYFIVIVFARRADKRDESKICSPSAIVIDEGGSYVYDLVVSTGVWRDSGTTANIALIIKGENRESKGLLLRSKGGSGESLSRGGIDGFVLIANESFGHLKELTFSHDNSGNSPSWFLETAVIKDRQTEEQWVFPANRWLAVEKDDEQIQAAIPCLDKRNPPPFPDQVRSRVPRRLADSHIWMSVFGKASSSTFTRVQRSSCCLSILFTAMIANAMFYNVGGESDGAIQVGPFKFSWRQIVVGAQSGLIIAPVNALIVFFFRSSKRKRKIEDKYTSYDEDEHLADTMKKSSCAIPHFFVYIGWILCTAATLTAAAFTLFYSLMWGKEISEQWLASILTSLAQDIFFLQPTKVMVVVVVISLFLSRGKGKRDSSIELENGSNDDSDLSDDDPKKSLKRYELQKMREHTKKEVKLNKMMKGAVLHLLFVFLMAIVCYGNRNNSGFLMTSTLKDPYLKFETVTHSQRLWGWMRQRFLPNIYAGVWYNDKTEKEEVYIENKMSILIGMPRMRQLRVKKSSCGRLSSLFPHCYYDYSFEKEDTTSLSLPGWRTLPYNTSWPEALEMCPQPWRFQSSEDLGNALPTWGTYHTYKGGGYIAVLGYEDTTADRVLSETLGQGWIDRQTRAVMIEFTVFNVNTNLISIATYFYEVLATGAAYTTKRVDTLALYSTESGAQQFYLICQFLFITMVLFYFVVLLTNLYRQRTAFFKSPWNLVEFIQIVSSVMSVAFYMLKAKSILKSIKAIQANPYEIVNFHSALSLAEWENVSIALAIFMATWKLLNLTRFNPHIVYLFSSFRQSFWHQLSFMGIFLIVFNAFAMSGIQMFGGVIHMYSSYLRAIIAQFEFLLGKAVPLEELRTVNRIIGPTFAMIYMLTMTILLMNMLVSMLNDSYSSAKDNVEDSAEDLEMVCFFNERVSEIFGDKKKKADLKKLFCDEEMVVNMCRFEAEPFCLNSRRVLQCTNERLEKVDRRISKLVRLAKNVEDDYLKEDIECLHLFSFLSESKGNLRQKSFETMS